jgi:hypothetical protein
MLKVTSKLFILSAVGLSGVMLSVMAPLTSPLHKLAPFYFSFGIFESRSQSYKSFLVKLSALVF